MVKIRSKNKKIPSLLIIVLLICSGVSFFIGLKFESILSPSGKEEKTLEVHENIISLKRKIYFSQPQLVKHKGYFEVKAKGAASYLMDIGKPILPVYITVFTFPLGTKIVNITYNHSKVKTIKISKEVIFNPGFMLTDMRKTVIKGSKDNSVYNSDKLYPQKWWEYRIGSGILNHNQTVFLSLHSYPVRYSPAKNTLYYIENAEITIRYKRTNISFIPKTREYDLLIIAPSNFSSSLKPLVDHKKKIGIRSKIVTVEEIYNGTYFSAKGRDRAEKIKYFIKDAVENWGVSYVLLVGDKDKIPVRYRHIMFMWSPYLIDPKVTKPIATDLYYADIYDANGSFCSWDANHNGIYGEYNWEWNSDKVDFYPNVYLGRLPCKDKKEVSTVVAKIIRYERNTYNKRWFNNLIICAGDSFPLRNLRLLIALLLPGINWKDITVREGEYVGDRIAENLTGFHVKKLYASQYLPWGDRKPLTKRNIKKEIENGAGFVLFTGHGSIDRWGTYKPLFPLLRPLLHGYTSKDVLSLRNKDKLPIVIIDGCLCGAFDQGDCLAWEFVRSENGGAVASFAYVTYSVIHFLRDYVLYDFSGYIDMQFFKSYMEGKDVAGELLVDVLTAYLNNHPYLSSKSYNEIEGLELFGDPTLKIGGYPC